MKDTRSNEIKAAIFLIIASALMLALSLRVSGTLDLLTRETYVVYARFDSVLGIAPMTKVTLNGVRVGRVKDIRLIEDDPRGNPAELVLELDRSKATLYKDAQAMITADTLLSNKHIDLQAGTKDPGTKLGDGAIIYGLPSVNIDIILQRAENVVASLETLLTDEEFLNSIRGVFSEAEELVSQLQGLSSTAREILEENREKVGSVVDNFATSSENFIQFTEQLNELTVSIQSDIHNLVGSADSMINENRPEIKKILAESARAAQTLADKIDPLLEDTHTLVNQLNTLVGDSHADVEYLLNDIEDTANNLKHFSKQLADQPWTLVYPTAPQRDPRNLMPAWRPASATDRMETLDAIWNIESLDGKQQESSKPDTSQ